MVVPSTSIGTIWLLVLVRVLVLLRWLDWEIAGVTCLLIVAEVVESLVFDLSRTFDFFSSCLLPSVHIDGPVFTVEDLSMDDVP